MQFNILALVIDTAKLAVKDHCGQICYIYMELVQLTAISMHLRMATGRFRFPNSGAAY
jgi:hypothetical protein